MLAHQHRSCGELADTMTRKADRTPVDHIDDAAIAKSLQVQADMVIARGKLRDSRRYDRHR